MRNLSVLAGLLLVQGALGVHSTFAQPAPAVGNDQTRAQWIPAVISDQQRRAAKELASILQTIRGQTELYRLQHGGTYPDFQKWLNWEQLTRKTSVDGVIKADGALGPYLPKPPVNTLRGASRVTTGVQEGWVVSDRQIGWAFTPEGHIHPLNERGSVLGDEDMDLLVNGGQQAASSTGPGARRAAILPATKPAPTPVTVARDLRSPDPQVRLQALGEMSVTAVPDATILLQIGALAESDPSREVRKLALEKMNTLNWRRNERVFAPLDLDTIVPGLIAAASDPSPATRRRALVVLGYLREQSDGALAAYRKAYADPDAGVQTAAVEQVCVMLDSNPKNMVLFKLFQEALAKPGATRDSAAHGFTWMITTHNSRAVADEVLKLAASADADARVMGAVAAGVFFIGPGSESMLNNVRAEDVAAGVQHRLAWVRTYATDHMFHDCPHWQLNGKTVLLGAVSNTDPEIASDAARRLCGDLPLGHVPGGSSSMLESEAAQRRKLAESSLELSGYVLLCRNKNPVQRLRGIAGLGGKGEAALGAVPVLAELFADPDRRVQNASRRAAIQILTPAKIPGVRY